MFLKKNKGLNFKIKMYLMSKVKMLVFICSSVNRSMLPEKSTSHFSKLTCLKRSLQFLLHVISGTQSWTCGRSLQELLRGDYYLLEFRWRVLRCVGTWYSARACNSAVQKWYTCVRILWPASAVKPAGNGHNMKMK